MKIEPKFCTDLHDKKEALQIAKANLLASIGYAYGDLISLTSQIIESPLRNHWYDKPQVGNLASILDVHSNHYVSAKFSIRLWDSNEKLMIFDFELEDARNQYLEFMQRIPFEFPVGYSVGQRYFDLYNNPGDTMKLISVSFNARKVLVETKGVQRLMPLAFLNAIIVQLFNPEEENK